MSTSTVPALDEKVADALRSQPYLRGRELRFETDQGRVVLRGRVGSYYHKLMAQEVVRRVDGVDSIQNDLEVSWS